MKTQVWAHRGSSHYAPENTLAAFELAVKQGADGIELDVQMTKDRRLVVVHDETIDRVSDGIGSIADYTLEELKCFRFNKLHPEYATAKIPELCEVYELLRPTNLVINVELKNGIVMYQGMEELVLEETKKMGFLDRTIFSSFHHNSLVRMRAMDTCVQLGILYADGWLDVISYAKHLKVQAIHPAWYHLHDENLMKQAREHNIKVHVWTVNEIPQMERMIANGVDAIITNRPDVCRRKISK